MKQWQAPMLIVLTRTQPAESVLTACKDSSIAGNPNDMFPGCMIAGFQCGDCEAQVQS